MLLCGLPAAPTLHTTLHLISEPLLKEYSRASIMALAEDVVLSLEESLSVTLVSILLNRFSHTVLGSIKKNISTFDFKFV